MFIDYLANKNPLVEVHPAYKMLYVALIFLASFLCSQSWLLLFFYLGNLLLSRYLLQISWPTLVRLERAPLLVLGVSLLTLILAVTQRPNLALIPTGDLLWASSGKSLVFYLTRSSMQRALHLGARVLSLLAALEFLALSTPLVEMNQVLRDWHVPAVLMNLTELLYRYIFYIYDTFETVITSQTLRLGYRNLRTGIPSLGRALGLVLSRTLEAADDLDIALELKLFDGTFRYLGRVYRPASWLEYALVALGLFALGGAILCRL